MSEYLTLGHMTPCDNFPRVKHYFLPHHGVFKNQDPNSSLRVVFDASSKTSTNVSLNDILLSGPKLQNDLCEVILRFRCHSVVFACDIRQMYRQIKIHPDDQHFQLIYWRETPTDLLKVFKLTTVTYGVTSAPFLAIRTLHQLAEDEGAQFPQAARVLKSQTFVDDIIAGADNVQEALTLQHDLTKLLSLGGFQLRKWCSNSDILISHISEDDREIPLSFQYSEQPIYNILGLQWNSTSDEFSYAVKISNVPHTKRSVLSAIARIYDPCGWLAPVVFLAKSFIQYLWTLGLQWDDPLSSNVAFRWEEILKNLARVKEITLPRSLFIERTSSVQLLGFCDASELGYAAVIYLRCASADNNTKIALLMAKSRVAPLKRISLPRLELCGAHLLAKLIHYSSNLVSNYCKMESVTAWCDSTIALSWIRTPPYRLKVFVANRVAQIQEWVPPERWFHVSSQHNPADCASRGLPTPLFAKNSLWWSGPRWLSLPPEDWPCSPFAPLDEDLPEVKQPIFNVCSSTVIPEWDLLFKFSKWSTLQRVVAFIRRFAHNCHRSGSKYGMLSSQELQKATHVICKLIQKTSFKEELLLLQKEQPCTKRMQRLSPFIDIEGLLREFITLVTKVEAMLNSRPLTPLSTDPADVSALTPGHFLIGTSMTAIPEDDFAALPTNRLSRWQTVQAFSQRIWRRWHQEYLHTLQQRSKWTRRRQNLKVGDLVAVHSPKTPPLQWCLARITKAIPGDDGIVRVVQLRTPKGTLTRPATRVFPLPIDD
ncbi:uncharacterized protein LOC124167111 [Ischnura elegans]|uniref:uncharacterized protein LOC124167111 n=1 Tax=Ischnura elegans TaxID=197161 RepID=UPI001ED889D9|nr:uncharacterized protein LOC124167111 [Ischnura elegans]